MCIFKVVSLHNLLIKLSRYFYFELISSTGTSVSCGKFYKEKRNIWLTRIKKWHLRDQTAVWMGVTKKVNIKQHDVLAHLSTKCSGWAIVTGLCPSSVVRRPSCVVRKLFYLNIFSSETTHWIWTKLHRNDPWVVPYQSCSNGSDYLHK